MKKAGIKQYLLLIILMVLIAGFSQYEGSNPRIIHYSLNPKEQDLHFFWKNDKGDVFENHGSLRDWLEKNDNELVFSMNGAMFGKDLSPIGLYIEDGEILKQINSTKNAYGNFYMQPNGIFYMTYDNKAIVCTTDDFKPGKQIKYATQSGPMLVINNSIHPKFNKGSHNLHIRNGVGILPDGSILFAISKKKINFYDFATFFKSMGCKNALYLDGFVSKMYLPTQDWEQTGGKYAIIIAETKAGNSK